jgi:hypothetical protein
MKDEEGKLAMAMAYDDGGTWLDVGGGVNISGMWHGMAADRRHGRGTHVHVRHSEAVQGYSDLLRGCRYILGIVVC